MLAPVMTPAPRRVYRRPRAVCFSLLIVAASIAIFLLAGCGSSSHGTFPASLSSTNTGGGTGGTTGSGGGTNGGGGGGSGGGVVTTDARTAVFDSIEATFATFDGTDQTAENEQMLAFIKTRPEFVDSGLSPSGAVWAQFADGTNVVIATNLVATPDDLADRSAALPAAPPRSPSRALGFPDEIEVLLGSALGTFFDPSQAELARIFTSDSYQPIADGATIDSLKNLPKVGALYILGHGATVRLHNGSSSQEEYTVWTATKRARDGSTDAAYAADLKDGTLNYFLGVTYNTPGSKPTKQLETRYGITTRFVDKYWKGKFGKSSIVFMNACNSDSPNAVGFKQAVLNAGASVYLGWTERVRLKDTYPTANYLFDRLIGANIFSDKESPAQRPFGYGPVLLEMAKRKRLDPSTSTNYDTSFTPPDKHHAATTANLRATTANGEFAQLAPSINTVGVDEQEDTLRVNGFFGPEEGEVRVNSTPLHIRSWSENQIVCDIPRSGDGAAGNVIVRVHGLLDSNIVQLTEWKGTATGTIKGKGSLQMVMTFHLHYRADANAYRTAPHDEPFRLGTNYIGVLDSKADYAFSGTYKSKDGTYQEDWTGEGTIPSFVRPPEGTDPVAGSYGLVFQGSFETDRSWSLNIRASGLKGHHIHTVLRDTQGKLVQDKNEDADVAWLNVGNFSGGLFLTKTDAGFNVPGGSVTNVSDDGESITLKWEPMSANFQPDPKDGRAAAHR